MPHAGVLRQQMQGRMQEAVCGFSDICPNIVIISPFFRLNHLANYICPQK
tara:strand:- start:438 stop:587 length:150 start_codon:yes stop_codon:yes gene_type:complete